MVLLQLQLVVPNNHMNLILQPEQHHFQISLLVLSGHEDNLIDMEPKCMLHINGSEDASNWWGSNVTEMY